MSDMTLAPRRRPLWRLFFMPVLLLIAAAAWSAFWFYSASKVDETADAWRAQEARSGPDLRLCQAFCGWLPVPP